ncbi:MAG: FAD binding domain-containing protein [Xanthomonadales bacterium]|nr:FAD binding domain-containing protein [Xanthomonadales bacterium]
MSLRSVKEYFAPGSAKEVLELLERYGEGALIVAGGSFVRGLDARDLLGDVEAMVDLRQLGLNQISTDAEGLSLGAMVTYAQLQLHEEIQNQAVWGAIKDALTYPPLQIRNVATVGGNIAAACPYFDMPVAALALDGLVEAFGPGGERTIALQTFFAGMFENTLESNEFVTGLRMPAHPARSASAFIKLETNANDLAIVNVGVRVTLDDANRCTEARVFIGGGGGLTPARAAAAESLLQGEEISGQLLDRAGAAVQSDLQLMADHRASAAYRMAMAKTLTARALRRAVARLN